MSCSNTLAKRIVQAALARRAVGTTLRRVVARLHGQPCLRCDLKVKQLVSPSVQRLSGWILTQPVPEMLKHHGLIGVAGRETKLVEKLPKELKGSLPAVEEIEAELAEYPQRAPEHRGESNDANPPVHIRQRRHPLVNETEPHAAASRTSPKAAWSDLPGRFQDIDLDAFVLMPDHIHGIVIVGAQFIAPTTSCQPPITNTDQGAINRDPTLGQIVQTFKAATTRLIRQITNTTFA